MGIANCVYDINSKLKNYMFGTELLARWAFDLVRAPFPARRGRAR